MDTPILFAAVAGIATAVAAWLILRAGERDEARLAAMLEISGDAGATPAHMRRQVVDALSRLVPDGIFLPLAWYPSAALLGEPAVKEMRALAVVLALSSLVLATQTPWALIAFVAAPVLARALVVRSIRVRQARERRVKRLDASDELTVQMG